MSPDKRWVTASKASTGSLWGGLISLLLRLLVGGLLIYSGFSKAVAPSAEFAAALAAYQLLPADLLPTLALVWPWLELLVGTYILFGYYTRVFAGVATGMFLIFLIVLGSTMLRNIDPGSCGCFGLGLSFSVRTTALLDCGLLLLSILLIVFTRRPSLVSADSWIAD